MSIFSKLFRKAEAGTVAAVDQVEQAAATLAKEIEPQVLKTAREIAEETLDAFEKEKTLAAKYIAEAKARAEDIEAMAVDHARQNLPLIREDLLFDQKEIAETLAKVEKQMTALGLIYDPEVDGSAPVADSEPKEAPGP